MTRDPEGDVFRVLVGKAFPDMRQNERRIRFIRAGDAVGTAVGLDGKPTPFVG